VKSGHVETTPFSPKPASIVDVLRISKALEIYKDVRTCLIVMQNIFCFILLQFYLLEIYYFVLHYMWGIFHHAYAKDAPLRTFVIFIAVSKRIRTWYKGTDRFVAETLLYMLHTQT
jgi:hypothetical protein